MRQLPQGVSAPSNPPRRPVRTGYVDDLQRYLNSVIDVDGARYRLVAIEEHDAVLAHPHTDPSVATLVRVPRADLVESMTALIRNSLL
jgi:hypothetical protein